MIPYYYTEDNELPATYIDCLPEMHAREVVCEWLDTVMRKRIIDRAKECFDDKEYSDVIEGYIALVKYTDTQDSYYKIMLMGQKYLIDVDALPGAGLDDNEVLKLRRSHNDGLEFVHGPHKYSHPEGKFELLRISKEYIHCRFERGLGRKLYVVLGPAAHRFEESDVIAELVSLWWPWVVYHRHCVNCIKISPTEEYKDAYIKTRKVEDLLDMEYDVWYTHGTTQYYKRYADGTWVSDHSNEISTPVLELLFQYAMSTRWLTHMPDQEDLLLYSFDVHYRHGIVRAYRQINLCHHIR